MIKSVLIANRGEIAIRIARTARRMGITTYGLRTNKEPDAVYLRYVDSIIDVTDYDGETIEFLNIELLIQLAKKHAIEAIHPGYGFLSENAQFAQRCLDENLIFIGPSPKVIKDMGDKTIAKEIAEKSGVPVLKGSKGAVTSLDEAVSIAHQIGFPVIIKAASGGGGRGMRIVRKAGEMAAMFKMATSEAQTSFNDPSVFIEKYVENPKHIEVQIVADNYGNVIHLGERECSIQRKHQKLIEEAPSPAINPELRSKITRAAVKLAKSVGYSTLGTVEFLLDSNGKFYFMEMNTRIQVEHPVTEMITGFDLVELQFRIASGERLNIAQKDVVLNGWAIEFRINAEDVQSNFASSLGYIKSIRFPQGNKIRIDTGIIAGTEITSWFDSMLAKLIVYGQTRDEAIKRARRALKHFQVKGIKTTVPFCKAVLENEKFVNGDYNTSFIDSQPPKNLIYKEKEENFMAALLAVYLYSKESNPSVTPETNIDPWVLNKRMRHL